jgi:hypothetical protein
VSKGRYVLAIMGGLTMTLLGLSIWLSARLTSPTQIAAGLAQPAAMPVTAPVERRVLRRTVVLDGVVRAPAPVEVRAPRGIRDGQVVVTAQPRRPGTRVSEGDRLVEVSGRPVFLLRGPMPMYRNLRLGSNGPDVAQLQLALARLGFRTFDRSGWFGTSTEASLRRFYLARGYRPATELVRPPSRQGGFLPPALAARPPIERVFVPWWELVFVQQDPAWVVSAPFAVGQRPDRPVLTLASGSPRIQLTLTEHQWGLVRRGAQARIELTRSGKVIDTTVRSMRPAEEITTSAGRPPTGAGTAFVWTEKPPPASSIGTRVRLTVETQRTPSDVLSVPLAAMWSRADGSTHVTVMGVKGPREVRVQAGLSVDGMVEVVPTGDPLHSGDLVVVDALAQG